MIQFTMLSMTALILTAGLVQEVSAFTFNLTGGDTALAWEDDFDNNDNNWVLSGAAISAPSLLGRTDEDTGDASNCSDPQSGGFAGYLHISENDGADGFPGPSLTWAEARNNLATPIDHSGGPVSICFALWSPTENSPRQLVSLQAQATPGE
jgi:hypothetical protein